MDGRGVMDAAKELQSLIDENKHKITEEGFYLELSNAAMKVHERAAALDKASDASEEESEEEENDWGWEDGDTPASMIASRMIDVVKFDDPDYFVNLVHGLLVYNPLHTRKPKARAMAIYRLLRDLSPDNPLDTVKLVSRKQHFLSRDGHGRFRYILKQHWLDDYYSVDADPRRHIIESLELLGENDVGFRQLMHLRGVYRALNELVDHSRISDLRAPAYSLLAKVGELVTN